MARMSRRTLLKGAGAAAFLGGSAAVLPLFELQGAKQTPQTCPSTDLSASEPELIISNWPAYIDPRNNPDSTYAVFQDQTGISVSYTDDVNDNIEFFGKIVNQMRACQPVDRDMFMLTDWMAARMINLGWLQKLDHANIPSVEANILPSLKAPAWDPNRDYSVPWQSALTGIAYNASVTDPVGSFSELLTRSDLKGRVTVLTEMRDTMLFMLLVVGADPLNFTDDEWYNALDELNAAVSDGQIRAFTGNEYLRGLKSGDIAACEAWSGDVIQAQFDDEPRDLPADGDARDCDGFVAAGAVRRHRLQRRPRVLDDPGRAHHVLSVVRRRDGESAAGRSRLAVGAGRDGPLRQRVADVLAGDVPAGVPGHPGRGAAGVLAVVRRLHHHQPQRGQRGHVPDVRVGVGATRHPDADQCGGHGDVPHLGAHRARGQYARRRGAPAVA